MQILGMELIGISLAHLNWKLGGRKPCFNTMQESGEVGTDDHGLNEG